MIFSQGALRFPRAASSLGAPYCPVHTGQSGAPQAGANLFSLYVYMNFMHLRKDELGKLVSP
jgi:hypothetical protein